MDLRLFAAILVGKIIAVLTKIKGGGATAAPGLYALKIDPGIVKKLTKKLPAGNIIISGTNGKTTTARLSTDILSTKFKTLHNRQGSNLLRGIASTLIARSDLAGNLNADLGIWETDEAAVPQAIENTNPKTIVLLNLFRDQLDRYGEVDTIRNRWQKGLSKLSRGSTLILNADDPSTGYLAKGFKGKVICFGVEDRELNLPSVAQVADIRHCLNCGSKLNYTAFLSAHMGHYTCPKCDFKRPAPNIFASQLKFDSNFSTSIKLTVNGEILNITYRLPGLYNVYNILASTALCQSFKIDHAKIKNKIINFSTAFGRFQKTKIQGKKVIIFLIKNPAGANEVLRTISLKKDLNLLAILNDKIADGRDVSWIWDTNWEILSNKIKKLTVSGTRCWDLANRLKYADFKMSKNDVYEDINYSIDQSIKNLNNKDTLIILPTYTAMLELQTNLQKKGEKPWHKQ